MKFGDREFPYSFSQNRTYEECPRKYKYKYVDGIKEPSSTAADFGSEVHKMLQEYANLQRGIEPELTLDERKFKVDSYVIPGYAKKLLSEFDKFIEGCEIIATEHKIEENNFVGYIDMMYRDDSHKYTPESHKYARNLVLVDYKTTKKPKTLNSIYNEGQLLVYKKFMQQYFPETNIFVQYFNILPFMSSQLTSYTEAIQPDVETCNALFERMNLNVACINNKLFPKKHKWCNWCFYKDKCDCDEMDS